MNILLCISYDGTCYHGFQSQASASTVQNTLELALKKMYRQTIRITGAGRTDAGVHAEKNYVNFHVSQSAIPIEKIATVLNTYLPDDIVVLYSKEAKETFHARYSAQRRCYFYQFYRGRTVPAVHRLYSVGVDSLLDFESMEKEAQGLVGTHDFRAFTVQVSKQRETMRTIYDIHLCYYSDTNLVCLYISANAFLWKMVRSIVGTLLHNALRRKMAKPIEYSVKDILLSGDNTRCATVAASKGLCLYDVIYSNI